MIPLQEWVKNHVRKFDQKSINEVLYTQFFRDENRPMFFNSDTFYSPADGTIIYSKIVNPKEVCLDIKGGEYSLNELTDNKLNLKDDLKYYICGIFMTFYDIHINRIPRGGILKWEDLDSIETYNMPMIAIEKNLFKGDKNYKKYTENMEYMYNNERRLNTVYDPKLNYTYYIVQIADEEVDVITHFDTEQNSPYSQCDRFSMIRWGSQVDLILPIDNRFNYEILAKEFFHVEAGIDQLVNITPKDK